MQDVLQKRFDNLTFRMRTAAQTGSYKNAALRADEVLMVATLAGLKLDTKEFYRVKAEQEETIEEAGDFSEPGHPENPRDTDSYTVG